MFNPFSSWADANKNNGSAPPPSVFGALPYPQTASNELPLLFPSFNPSDLNCAAVGAHGQVYYNIVTDPHNPGYTVVKNASGKNMALIEWQSHPLVEIRGVFGKQPVKDWLKLSREHTSRNMEIRGIQYSWAPRGKALELTANGPSGVIVLARITRGEGKLMLDVTGEAIQLGILDSIVTATVLLQCGRNID
ncbi:hypothetical protein JOM56_000262 [Amanita muscaria]